MMTVNVMDHHINSIVDMMHHHGNSTCDTYITRHEETGLKCMIQAYFNLGGLKKFMSKILMNILLLFCL